MAVKPVTWFKGTGDFLIMIGTGLMVVLMFMMECIVLAIRLVEGRVEQGINFLNRIY